MRLFKDTAGLKSYANIANAEKAADKVVAAYGAPPTGADALCYVVMATDAGRFLPLFVLRDKQQHWCGGIAHAGFCVTF